MSVFNLNYKPAFPDNYHPKIGIVGVGNIVRNQHLQAYKKYGVVVGGVYDINPEAVRLAQAAYDVGTVYDSLDAMLTEPTIDVIDIGTHPTDRLEPVTKALQAGKHVLVQKPVAPDVATTRQLIAVAHESGKLLAVNQNGRFSPPWRLATLLIESGAIGEVFSVSHQFDTHFGWVTSTVYDKLDHWLIYDYAIHWLDISLVWLKDKTLDTVRAREYRIPVQPQEGQAKWGAWVELAYTDGSNVMVRSVGASASTLQGHQFWIHGTKGTIRGMLLHEERLILETNNTTVDYRLEGAWFPDGFAGAMAELLAAVAEGRAPSHAAENNVLTLQTTLAACRSAERDGQPVRLEEIS